MRVLPLGSGSRGNATLIEFEISRGLFGPTRLLLDAGLSARELALRLSRADVSPDSIDAILLSHEHEDHARGAPLFSRRHGVAVYCTVRTLEAMNCSRTHFAEWRPLATGRRLRVAGVEVETFRVPHDAADPVGFVLAADGLRFGLATDLGHATPQIVDRLQGCDVLMIESNHDDRMLQEGPYPFNLKRRVAGRLGHLSNREAAALLRQTVSDACRCVVLAHLSEKNNTSELARRSATAAVSRRDGARPEIRIAPPSGPMLPLVF